MESLHDVTVGIPTYEDDPRILSLSLDAIEREGVGSPPVIVDMSRTDAIAELAATRPEPIRYVRFGDSTGVAASRNRIVELAQTRYVLFIDADAVPLAGWARAMAGAFTAQERVGLVGARIVPSWPRNAPPLFTCTIGLELLGMLDLGPEPCELPRVMGTSYAVDRERIPGDEPFRRDLGRRPGRLISGEEVQLSLDVRASGGVIRYEPAATVRHHVRPDRVSWRWMLRRVYSEGRELHLWDERPEAFPRPLTLRDRAFQVATTPAFLAGRLRGLERA